MSHLQQHTGKHSGSLPNILASSSLWCRAFIKQRQCLSLYSEIFQFLAFLKVCHPQHPEQGFPWLQYTFMKKHLLYIVLNKFLWFHLIVLSSGLERVHAQSVPIPFLHPTPDFMDIFILPSAVSFQDWRSLIYLYWNHFNYLWQLPQDEDRSTWNCHWNKLTGLSLTCGNRFTEISAIIRKWSFG